jgi:quercetin dioxygenase-like cupin family protein
MCKREKEIGMNGKRFWKVGVCVVGLSLAGAAIGQQSPPTESKGVKSPTITSLDLGPEIEGMDGRQLRMRMFTIEPGGVLAVHPHKDRPSAVYLLKGTITEFREGGFVKEHREGESWAEGKATTHWVENKGTTPAVFISADIFKP